jgi:hypothetical protein
LTAISAVNVGRRRLRAARPTLTAISAVNV